jgi:phosphate:Na+ symporter
MHITFLLPLVGLALFLYGLIQLSSLVQKFFSVRIRDYIRQSVKRPLSGIFVGLVSAVLAQSSSASNVLTIGMVSAGLITFYQSIGILLGAGIGGTINAQLIAFKFTAIAPFFIILGFILLLLTHGKKRIFGQMVFYFGLLFFGLSLIEASSELFKHTLFLTNLLTSAQTPLIGILIGVLASIIFQASAIPIGLMVIFAGQGIVGVESAMPIVLGACLGTTIDLVEIIAAITTKRGGQRVALVNFLFRLIALAILFPFLGKFIALLKIIYSQPAYQIALGNILFALLVTILGLIIMKPLSYLIKKILPGQEKSVSFWPEYLDSRQISQPKLALEGTVKELERMTKITKDMYSEAADLNFDFKHADFRSVEYLEMVVDNLQKEILTYLDKVSEQKMSQEESSRMLYYSIIVDDVERIADLALNIAKLARYQKKYHLCLTADADKELRNFMSLTLSNINYVLSLFTSQNSETIERIVAIEQETDHLYTQYRQNHFARFFAGSCSAEAGPIFIGLLSNLERISDHCKNIADYWQELKENYLRS